MRQMTMPNNMPAIIWAHMIPVAGGRQMRSWSHLDIRPIGWEQARYIRDDVAKRMVAKERERCIRIAQRVFDKYVRALNSSRLDPKEAGNLPYYDGASDAAEEIVAAIEDEEAENEANTD
jgi:hypothetical protein